MEKIWEKRDDETAKAFDAFCTYRNLPPSVRSIHRTYSIKYTKDTKQAPKFIKDWASQNDWVKRAEAWDAYRDQQTEAARIEDWEDFQENILKYAKGLLMKGARRLQNIQEEEIPAMALSKWALDTLKLFRDIRGEPSEIVEQRHMVEGQLSIVEVQQQLEEKLNTLVNFNDGLDSAHITDSQE